VRIWDPDHPQVQPAVLRGHEGPIWAEVRALAAGFQGARTLIVSGGIDATVRIWDPDHLDVEPIVLRGHGGVVGAVAVASQGARALVVSGGSGGTVRLWDPDHGYYDCGSLGRRFTVSPEARRQMLDWLLELNHERYADEATRPGAKGRKAGKQAAPAGNMDKQLGLGDG
jgi:WD40 repeat protein